MRGTSDTQARGVDLLLAHVQVFAPHAQGIRPPQSRLTERVGPRLAALLVYALTGGHGTRRSGNRL